MYGYANARIDGLAHQGTYGTFLVYFSTRLLSHALAHSRLLRGTIAYSDISPSLLISIS